MTPYAGNGNIHDDISAKSLVSSSCNGGGSCQSTKLINPTRWLVGIPWIWGLEWNAVNEDVGVGSDSGLEQYC